MLKRKQVFQTLLALFCIYMLVVQAACSSGDDVEALGTLERDRITLSATAAEIITRLPVVEGSAVRAGDLLVQLDPTLQQATVARASADVETAKANLDRLRNGARSEEISAAQARVDAAQATLKESERELARTRQLAKQDLAPAAELEIATTRRDANRAKLNEAREQLHLLSSGSREEDIRQADAQFKAAQAVLQREQQTLKNLSIFATRDGVLDSLPWNVGERVYVGAPLAILLTHTAPFARVYIPERFRVSIKVGDSLRVSVDGIEQAFEGRVRWLSSEPAFTPYYALNQQERSRLVYLAEIQLGDDAHELPSGIPAQVMLH